MIAHLRGALRAIVSAKGGNVAILFAISVLPLIFALGMGVDYVSAARRRDKISAIADAAALSAVTPAMMTQSPTVAKAAAAAMFAGQVATVSGITMAPGNPVITVTDTPSATGTTRNVSIAFEGASADYFPGVLGSSTIAIGGKSGSQATTQPNINFYLMLDTSPSMAIAATQPGIDKMVNATKSQGGCAFACHESNPGADNLGNPNNEDNYALSKSLSVTLRIDLVQQAVSQMMDTANNTMPITLAVYKMALYDFDTTSHLIQPMTNPTTAKAAASNIQLLEVYKNGCLTSTICNNDEDTNWDGAMGDLNAAMGTPGNGTNNPGDSPQEVLFIVSDGLIDEDNGGREMAAMGGSWCTTVKNRGIRIAVLYTTYNPLPTNSFYQTYIAPFQPSIATSMQKCASPGLFFQVNTGGDIGGAMSTLFQAAVGAAHLTQ